jgi:GNAT superfamily N-acetyltransferase
MGVTYFKRFRMEIDLNRVTIPTPALPGGYAFVPWDLALLHRHAAAKYASFRAEIDAQVFPCLGDSVGCLRLMNEIARRETFLPSATWLLTRVAPDGTCLEDCGTIQGIVQPLALGAVQNIGIAPAHRGLGLGRALMLQALCGFRGAQMARVTLEVTAKNLPAVQLYRSLGFRLVRTTYKAVDLPTPVHSVS